MRWIEGRSTEAAGKSSRAEGKVPIRLLDGCLRGTRKQCGRTRKPLRNGILAPCGSRTVANDGCKFWSEGSFRGSSAPPLSRQKGYRSSQTPKLETSMSASSCQETSGSITSFFILRNKNAVHSIPKTTFRKALAEHLYTQPLQPLP